MFDKIRKHKESKVRTTAHTHATSHPAHHAAGHHAAAKHGEHKGSAHHKKG